MADFISDAQLREYRLCSNHYPGPDGLYYGYDTCVMCLVNERDALAKFELGVRAFAATWPDLEPHVEEIQLITVDRYDGRK